MKRSYYDDEISEFMNETADSIIGQISRFHSQDIVHEQINAWRMQIELLKSQLAKHTQGHIFIEFSIPRMGKRADVILLINGIVFVIEFKTGSPVLQASDRRQVEGYALDLKNFHEDSHKLAIIPILIGIGIQDETVRFVSGSYDVFETITSNGENLDNIIKLGLNCVPNFDVDFNSWMNGSYKPTPTIIQAAQALYADHKVEDIARNDAGAKNLSLTSSRIRDIVAQSKFQKRKSICFVTGVPGSGKTLVGLDLATSSMAEEKAVFLSGNGPLVEVLREALARDEAARVKGLSKAESLRRVSSFIQNVHHFRDDALQDSSPPNEHIVIFDEAQRAWDVEHTADFMTKKRAQSTFSLSEPEFLIEVMDRHEEWCVIVALIGGGQEINTGETGLQGWRDAILSKFQEWDVYYSDHLSQPEYAGGVVDFSTLPNPVCSPETSLHLSASMRSFRAEGLSSTIHHLVDGDYKGAAEQFALIRENYPIAVTRDLDRARKWVTQRTRGDDSKGLIASSGAIRLRPSGIFVKNKLTAPFWFLNLPSDVRSCHALEDVATEFDIQGLELDWTIVAWDGDFRYVDGRFEHWKFRGTNWQQIRKIESKSFLENAYRVLLTRARQGMIIFIPEGSNIDSTRRPDYYDGTFEFLRACGFQEV